MPKILVVDDDADILQVIRLTLEQANYSVIEARNGAEGLDSVVSNHPDLILLDVMMDTYTDGFQFALRLRSPDPKSPYRAYRNIPIIILTSIHTTTDLRFQPEKDYLPVDEFIEKPLDPDDLIERIDRILRRNY